MSDPMTLVERLRNPRWFVPDGSINISVEGTLDIACTLADMREAADEIERLRVLAGAVSAGENFQELRNLSKPVPASSE